MSILICVFNLFIKLNLLARSIRYSKVGIQLGIKKEVKTRGIEKKKF